MSRKENEYFMRGQLLLHKTSFILRKIVERELKGKDLDELLKDSKDKLKFEFKKNRQQLKKLYPPANGKTDIEEWDVQMLVGVILYFFKLSDVEKKHVKKVKWIRNTTFAHNSSATFSEKHYKDVIEWLEEAITELSAGFEEHIKNECKTIISDCTDGCLDVTTIERIVRYAIDTDIHQVVSDIEQKHDEGQKNFQKSLKEALSEQTLQIKRYIEEKDQMKRGENQRESAANKREDRGTNTENDIESKLKSTNTEERGELGLFGKEEAIQKPNRKPDELSYEFGESNIGKSLHDPVEIMKTFVEGETTLTPRNVFGKEVECAGTPDKNTIESEIKQFQETSHATKLYREEVIYRRNGTIKESKEIKKEMGEEDLQKVLLEVEKEILQKENRFANKTMAYSLRKNFRLIFQAVKPEDLKEFHNKCDGKGPTLTVLHGASNILIGGYTSKNWNAACKTEAVKDDHAFLFYAYNSSTHQTCKFYRIINKDSAIICDRNFGPTFGGKSRKNYDLQSYKLKAKKPSTKVGDFLQLNGKINIGTAYQSDDTLSYSDINGMKMVVKMVDVYQVVDIEKMSRVKPEDDEIRCMKEELENFPLSASNIPVFNILFIGETGAGKSAFCHSLASVFSDGSKGTALAVDDIERVKKKVHIYSIENKSNKKLYARIINISGFEQEHTYDNDLENILSARENISYTAKLVEVEAQEQYTTFIGEIHVVCFVVDITKCVGRKEDVAISDRFRKIERMVWKKGIPIVAAATKCDLICQSVQEDADNVYSSPRVRDNIITLAKLLGLDENSVFPLVNYVNDKQLSNGNSRMVIHAFHSMLKCAWDVCIHCKENAQNEDTRTEHKGRMFQDGQMEREYVLNKVVSKLEVLKGKNLRALLVGPVNSGKSSFIDSINSALAGVICRKASGCHTRAEAAVSSTEKLYPIKYKNDEGGEHISTVTLGDMPGFQNTDGVELEHVQMVIEGQVPDQFKIEDGFCKSEAGESDGFQSVCFVFDVLKIDKLSEKTCTICEKLTSLLYRKGIPHIVILTRCDECQQSQLNSSTKLYSRVRTILQKIGFKETKVLPVQNYVHESRVITEMDIKLLGAFLEILELSQKK